MTLNMNQDIRSLFNTGDVFAARLRKLASLVETGELQPAIGSRWNGTWYFVQRNSGGEVLWKSVQENALDHEGSGSILGGYFQAASIPSNLYIRLFNDTPVNTDHLSDLVSEASGSGYDPATDATLARSETGWTTLAAQGTPNTHYKLSSKTCTFHASGGSWGPVTYAILASAATGTSGLVIGFVALSQSRTLNSGDTMDISIDVTLQ